MPLHLIQKANDTKVNIEAIGDANDACPGQWYFATDTGQYYYGLNDGSLAGPVGIGEDVTPGPYASDEAAALDGVAVGQKYKLSADNIWSMAEGVVKYRVE